MHFRTFGEFENLLVDLALVSLAELCCLNNLRNALPVCCLALVHERRNSNRMLGCGLNPSSRTRLKRKTIAHYGLTLPNDGCLLLGGEAAERLLELNRADILRT